MSNICLGRNCDTDLPVPNSTLVLSLERRCGEWNVVEVQQTETSLNKGCTVMIARYRRPRPADCIRVLQRGEPFHYRLRCGGSRMGRYRTSNTQEESSFWCNDDATTTRSWPSMPREGTTATTTATTSTTSNKQGWKTTQGLRGVKGCQSCPLMMRTLKRLQFMVIMVLRARLRQCSVLST
jgi:hypothetical protein